MDDGGPVGSADSSDSVTAQFRRTYDWTATSPSVAAIEALATVEGVDPVELATELDITLYDHVDPEALDALLGGGTPGSICVTFTVENYQICFDGVELVVCQTTSR